MRLNNSAFIFVFLGFSNTYMKAKNHLPVERIEPPFWFAGMHNPEVQILFYGKNISQYYVATTVPHIITKVTKTNNPNYLFVTITIQKDFAHEIIFMFKKNNKVAFTQKYQLRQRRENAAQRSSFDSSDTFYLLMPDRFANGNTNNDNDKCTNEKYNRALPGGRHGGDIEGIIRHLDYIQSLGITTIWSTPLCEDNDPVFSYHSYGQSDVYKIDPRFGTNEDYVRLASEIHKRDMKLVIDYVTNHWGIEHWMFKDAPTPDWFNQFGKYTQTNHKRSTLSDSNASQYDKDICLKGWFAPAMPDLNITNPLVLKYLIQNAIWWMEYANLDGIRVDTYNYADPQSMVQWTKAILAEYPNLNIIGEITQRNQALLSYWQKDSSIGKIKNFNSHLPSIMDFALGDALQMAFNENESDWGLGMTRIYDNFANDFLYPNVNNLMIFAENHDSKRLNEVYGSDIRKYKMAIAVLATVRGIPQLYYGSEIGMAGNQYEGDAAIRQDFPGGWEDDANNAFTKAGRTPEQQEYFDFTAALFTWRKTKSVIHSGKMTHYIPNNNAYVYFRHNTTETIMVILNNMPDPQTIKTNRFKENIGSFKKGTDMLTKQSFDIKTEISLEAKSVLILELE